MTSSDALLKKIERAEDVLYDEGPLQIALL